jgi:hypothetical protein
MTDSRNIDDPGGAELEYFELCSVCGQLFDLRDLAQVRAHLHPPEFEKVPARPN